MDFVFGFLVICLIMFFVARNSYKKRMQEEDARQAEIERQVAQRRAEKEQQEKVLARLDKFTSEMNKLVEAQEKERNRIESYEEALLNNGIDLSPGSFMELRKKYRAMYRDSIKVKDVETAQLALNNLYKTALLYVICYGSQDGNAGVIGYTYDAAIDYVYSNLISIQHVLDTYSYAIYGRILNCAFLSELDWKHFEGQWHPRRTVDLKLVYRDYPGQKNPRSL